MSFSNTPPVQVPFEQRPQLLRSPAFNDNIGFIRSMLTRSQQRAENIRVQQKLLLQQKLLIQCIVDLNNFLELRNQKKEAGQKINFTEYQTFFTLNGYIDNCIDALSWLSHQSTPLNSEALGVLQRLNKNLVYINECILQLRSKPVVTINTSSNGRGLVIKVFK